MPHTEIEQFKVAANEGYEVPLRVARAAQPHGPALLILPAMGLAAGYYGPFMQALAAAGYDSVVMEQRGMGESALRASRRVDWDFSHYLDFDIPATEAWMRNAFGDTREIVPLGHSLGGHLAACYATARPDDFSRLGLIASASPWMGAYTGKALSQLRVLNRVLGPLSALLGYFPGEQLGFAGREARGVIRDWRSVLRTNRYAWPHTSVDFDAHITAFTGRVLSIRITGDSMAPEAGVEAILDKFGRAQLRRATLPDIDDGKRIDHFRWARRPQRTLDVLTDWLADGSAARA